MNVLQCLLSIGFVSTFILFRLCLSNIDGVNPDRKSVDFDTKTKYTGNQSRNPICKY